MRQEGKGGVKYDRYEKLWMIIMLLNNKGDRKKKEIERIAVLKVLKASSNVVSLRDFNLFSFQLVLRSQVRSHSRAQESTLDS